MNVQPTELGVEFESLRTPIKPGLRGWRVRFGQWLQRFRNLG